MTDSETEDIREEVGDSLEYVDDRHEGATLARLNTLRKGGHLCDVVMEVDGHNIPAHRAILACASNYLFHLFSAKDGTELDHFKLENVDFDSFNILVNYAYTSRLEVPGSKVKTVYRAATMLKIQAAADACAKYLYEHLEPNNCLGIRAFVNSLSDSWLTPRIDAFIQEHLDQIKESPELKMLPVIKIDLLGEDEMDVTTDKVSALGRLTVEWAQRNLDIHPMDQLAKHLHKLYLASDNTLRDCQDTEAEGHPLNNSIEVKDYKRLNKLIQTAPKIGKTNGRWQPPQTPLPKLSVDRQPSQDKEWKVIASNCTDDRWCFCIAMLNNTLTRLSINIKSLSMSNGGASCTASDGSLSPQTSPRGSICGDKQYTLTQLMPMSTARCAVGTAVLNDLLIALGGYDRGDCLNSVEAFNMKENVWETMPPMLSPRGRFNATQLHGKMYACGGSNGSHELKSVEIYDPAVGKWCPLPDMLSQRSSGGVTVMDGLVYAVGGWNGRRGSPDCECYNPATNKWTAIPPLNTGRSESGVSQLHGNLIAVGGCDSWNTMNTVEIYRPAENKWSFLPQLNTNRRGAGVAMFNDKLYVIGGSDGTSALATVEVFDPVTECWTTGPTMTTPRANVGVAVLNGRLFAVGGFSGKFFLDTVEYLTAGESQEWCSFVPVEGAT